MYLIRSLGTVWGVSISSAIVQTTLSSRLPDALGDIPDKWEVSLLQSRLPGSHSTIPTQCLSYPERTDRIG